MATANTTSGRAARVWVGRQPWWIEEPAHEPRWWTLALPSGRWRARIEREASTSALTEPDPSLQTLEVLIDFDQPDATRAFLKGNSFLYPLVLDAYVELTRSFGAIQPRMTVVENPEEPGDRKLYLLASVGGPVDEAMRRLATFDDSYWLEAVTLARGLMNVDVEVR